MPVSRLYFWSIEMSQTDEQRFQARTCSALLEVCKCKGLWITSSRRRYARGPRGTTTRRSDVGGLVTCRLQPCPVATVACVFAMLHLHCTSSTLRWRRQVWQHNKRLIPFRALLSERRRSTTPRTGDQDNTTPPGPPQRCRAVGSGEDGNALSACERSRLCICVPRVDSQVLHSPPLPPKKNI